MITKYSFFILVIIFCTFTYHSTAQEEEADDDFYKGEYKLPQAVINAMSTRQMRMYHFVFHNVRDMWNLLDDADKEKLRQLGWEPPRPSQRYGNNGESIVLENNGSGEDFLYMHTNMINEANRIAQTVCPYAKVVGFKRIPPPGDKRFPVQPVYPVPGIEFTATDEGLKSTKTDEFYWDTIKPLEELYNDPDYLKNLTLYQLGSRLEFTIHNWLHFRYSSKPALGFRPQPVAMPVPPIDAKWDDPSYNWLADFYSAHVNRLFWKIHGWVNNIVEKWRLANGLAEITWQYKWEGGPSSSYEKLTGIGTPTPTEGGARLLMEGMDHGENTDVLDKVVDILVASGHCKSAYSQIHYKFE